MALNNGNAPKTTKAQPNTKADSKPAAQTAKTVLIVLAVGASYTFAGQRYEPDTLYEVNEELGDFLLSLKAHGETDQFREGGRKDLGLTKVVIGGSLTKAPNVETAEDLAEIQAHLDGGAKTTEGADAGEGSDGKQETVIE